VCGDFNEIRCLEERRSLRGEGAVAATHFFNRFIDDNELIDLPLCGRKYTWYKGDGSCMSRIDRFLLSEDWCAQWPNCFQVALLRGLSDHCPLQLLIDEENWGPRLTRMLKCWQDIPGYRQFVKEKWNSLKVDGWGGYVLKEKLKLLKFALKEWHSAHVQNIPGRIASLKTRLSDLDEKAEEYDLTVEEVEELRGVSYDLHSLSRVNTSISWQQSRLLWLREGDVNSKYFHFMLANRRRQNTIVSLLVNGSLVEGVQPTRDAIYSHFKEHFAASNMATPGVDIWLLKR